MIQLLLALSLSASAATSAPAGADQLFEKGLYQEASKAYEAQLKDPEPARRWRAQYRLVECEALLFRLAEAAERAFALALPSDPLWKGRFLLLRAEIAREMTKQYSGSGGRMRQLGEDESADDIEEGAPDATRLTGAQWHERARKAYLELWPLRQALLAAPLDKERDFVDLSRSQLPPTPTLWDFAALRWGEYLLAEDPAAGEKPLADSFFEPRPARVSAAEAPAALAAVLFDESARRGGDGREAAQGLWTVRRLLIPVRYTARVQPPSDWRALRRRVAAALERQMAQGPALARAEAGLEAARLHNGDGECADAVRVCREVESSFPAAQAARSCAQLRAQIELPVLNMSARFAPPPGKGLLRLHTRNLETIHLRLYRLDPREQESRLERRPEDWSFLRHADPKTISDILARREPDHAWTARPRYPAPYAYADTPSDPPALRSGFYLAVASSDSEFRPGRSMISGVIANVSDLMLIATAGPRGAEAEFAPTLQDAAPRRAPGVHLYTLDRRTGAPRRSRLDAFRRQDWRQAQRVSLETDDAGLAAEPVDFVLRYGQNTNVSLDPLAESGADRALLSNAVYVGHSPLPPFEVHLETDRAIYRPGQEVRFKATVIERLPRGFRVYQGLERLSVTAHDANGQPLFQQQLALNRLGSASGAFKIPAGRLLGGYALNGSIHEGGHGFSGSTPFAVEEYKRPEFELLVDASSGAWRFGAAATVAGRAKYYFGGPVSSAPVSYRVFREPYVPWFCWWWRGWGGRSGRVEVASGALKTDKDGRFSFTVVPTAAESLGRETLPARLRVEVEARDAGGRTIKAERAFTAGASASSFMIEPPAGFLAAGRAIEIPVSLVTLDGDPIAGRGSFTLRRLEGEPADEEQPEWQGSFGQSPSLERIFAAVPDGAAAAQGPLSFSAAQKARARLPGLKAGVYRLTVKADDPWGGKAEQSVILLAVPERGPIPLPLPAVAISEKSSYRPGETARVLLGSAKGGEAAFVEIWGGQYLLERTVLRGAGLRLLSVPVGADHKGGFTLRWFAAKDGRLRHGQTQASVPWADRELKISMSLPAAVPPGQKARWTLLARDASGRPVDGEALVRVYDRSLDYYASAAGFWTSGLYGRRGAPGQALGSLWTPYAQSVQVEQGPIRKIIELWQRSIQEPQPPTLRLGRGRVRHRYAAMRGMAKSVGESVAMEEGAALPASAPMPSKTDGGGGARDEELGRSDKKERENKAQVAPAAAVRKDFSETALFAPQLALARGRATVALTMPERLTSWTVQALVLTADAKHGALSAAVATRKELMVRVEVPRFYREGDEGRITAVVHNETKAELSGTLELAVLQDGKPAAARLGLEATPRGFRVPAGGAQDLSWPIKAPRGAGEYTVRATARSGTLVDAEERALPVLPSRVRLVESAVVFLDGTTSTVVAVPGLQKPGKTRVEESVHLQIDPQLALVVLNSLPFLVTYPHECTEQLLNRYVPMAIVGAFYRAHPGLAQSVLKIPRRDTLTPAWDRSDPRRQTALLETPWEQQSKGQRSVWPMTDLLDPRLVARESESAEAKLRSYQNGDGGFPWFPGGKSDPYISLVVLAGWAEAQRYGIKPPQDAARRALQYVLAEIPRRLKPEESSVALALYAAYVVTAYPPSWAEAQQGRALARVWLEFAEAHRDAMTPFGRGYAAHAWWRLGEKAKGEAALDRALDGLRQDPIAGAYWQPEKISWVWYNDSVEKHAFLLRTLMTVRPKDARIPGLIQWLVFNRKGSEWRSTKASAAAIYAILDAMKQRGALSKPERFTTRWGGQTLSAEFKADDWLAEPARWSREGAAATAAHGRAELIKQGPGLAFASLVSVFTTDEPMAASGPGLVELERKFFHRVKRGDEYRLQPLAEGDAVAVGDEVEVQLKVRARAQFEYVLLKDPRMAGFESETLRSGWKWETLSRYEEPRDSLTNHYMDWLPHGEFVLRSRVRPTTPGRYRLGPAQLQSMYAPEITAYSSSFSLEVKE